MHTLNLVKACEKAALKSIVERCIELRAGKPAENGKPGVAGLSWRECGDVLGVQWNNLHRWTTAYLADGAEALGDDRADKSGRPSEYESFAQDPAVRQRLKQIYMATIGASSPYMTKRRRTGSMALTLQRFADMPECPERLAKLLRRGCQPKPLVNVIREITIEMEQLHRGPKHASLNADPVGRRRMAEIMGDNTERAIVLGDWWVFDDMSTNFPFWWTDADGVDQVGRQGLYVYDKAGRWLGFELLGTSRDSYTAAMILRFMRRLMQTYGVPKRGIILEKSVWKSRSICGYRISPRGTLVEDETEADPLSEEVQSELKKGIRALGIELKYTWTPRAKPIEGAFNYYQRVFPTIWDPARQDIVDKLYTNIGRHAGEFERGAKALRRAHAQSHHPEDLGFIHIGRHAELSEATCQFINGRQFWDREGDKVEVPPYPQGRALSQDDMAVFLPHKTEVSIRGGRVTGIVAGIPFDFQHPENFVALGDGYRVAIKFDPTEPLLGAAIYNLETSSINHRGYKVGEFICWAEFQGTAPAFDWRSKEDRDDTAKMMRQRYNQLLRSEYRAIGIKHARVGSSRDGKGNVIEISASAGQSPVPETAGNTARGAASTSTQLLRAAGEPAALPTPRGGYRLRALEQQAEETK